MKMLGFDEWIDMIVYEARNKMLPADWDQLHKRPAMSGIKVGVKEDLTEDMVRFGYNKEGVQRTELEAKRFGCELAGIYTRRMDMHRAILANDMEAMDKVWNAMSPEEKPWVVAVLKRTIEYFGRDAFSN